MVYKGKLQTFNWYEIPTDLLKYNFLNGRIGSEVKEFNQLGKDLSSMNPLMQMILLANGYGISLKLPIKKPKDLKEKGQIEPGVITRDGIIVDGNRRFMLTCRLNNELGLNREFKAIILEETYEDGGYKDLQIKLLETELQISKDEKVGYDPIEKYIRIKEFKRYVDEERLKDSQIIKMFKLKSEKDLNSHINIATLMEDYLEFISAPNMWSRLKNSEDLFINLEKCVELYNKNKGRAAWNFEDIDVYKFKLNGFKIIRWIYNTNKTQDWNPQKLRALYFKNSEATIFSNEKIFREFSETIQKAEKDFKMPSIEKHSAENGIERSKSAEQIDKLYADKINSAMLEALGRADTKIKDKKKINEPVKLITDSLHKLEI